MLTHIHLKGVIRNKNVGNIYSAVIMKIIDIIMVKIEVNLELGHVVNLIIHVMLNGI